MLQAFPAHPPGRQQVARTLGPCDHFCCLSRAGHLSWPWPGPRSPRADGGTPPLQAQPLLPALPTLPALMMPILLLVPAAPVLAWAAPELIGSVDGGTLEAPTPNGRAQAGKQPREQLEQSRRRSPPPCPSPLAPPHSGWGPLLSVTTADSQSAYHGGLWQGDAASPVSRRPRKGPNRSLWLRVSPELTLFGWVAVPCGWPPSHSWSVSGQGAMS